jgi:hypothetical protein
MAIRQRQEEKGERAWKQQMIRKLIAIALDARNEATFT